MSYTILTETIEFDSDATQGQFDATLRGLATTIVDCLHSDDQGNDEDFIDLLFNFEDDETVEEITEYLQQFVSLEGGKIRISTTSEDAYLYVFDYLCKDFSKLMTKSYAVGMAITEDSKMGSQADQFVLTKEGEFGAIEDYLVQG